MLNKIKTFLLQSREFEDDTDGEYVYRRHINPINAFLINMFSTVKVKKDRRRQTFGRIKGNIFYYVTFPMIFVFGIIIWGIVAAFANLLPYYETNVFLNSLIISFMIYGILKTFHNAFILYKTARFFRLMESIIRKENIPQTDIYALRRSLERDGYLVNTVTMVETIDDIEKFGHPNFNDHRARLIKSKLGFRVSKGKGNVSYIAGILVMLGLLGTFLGLLATIDSVGAALGGMSNIGGDGGVDTEDMSRFITSLSRPLEGMGLAFSSSLFGLSGSLLIGFFLYLSGTPQNSFIENISRWIDNRIPVHNPKHTEMVKNSEKAAEEEESGEAKIESAAEARLKKINPPVKDQDLKDWLSGYIYMSVKTNNIMKKLCDEMAVTAVEIQKVTDDSHLVRQTQYSLMEGVNASNALLSDIESHNKSISDIIPDMTVSAKVLAAKVEEMRIAQHGGNEALIKMHDYLHDVPHFIKENQGISQQMQGNAALVSEMITRNDAQSQESGQVNNQMLAMLEAIKGLTENAQKTNVDAMSLRQENIEMTKAGMEAEKENMGHVVEGFKGMQGAMAQIAQQIDSVNEQIKSEKTPQEIHEIKGFVAELNGLQKNLVQSIQVLAQELSDNKYGKINETLIEKIERKINDLEEKLKGFLSKK